MTITHMFAIIDSIINEILCTQQFPVMQVNGEIYAVYTI